MTSKRNRLRHTFHLLRMLMMLALLAASTQLVIWNRNTDPRFYRFLGTAPGQMLSEWMDWPNLYLHRQHPESDAALTDEERLLKRKLEEQVLSTWPTHILTLGDGREEFGRILRRNASGVMLEEYLGGKGSMQTFIRHEDIVSEALYTQPPPDVTQRDIAFQMEYPQFHLTYFGHYILLSDAPYFQIESSVQALETLREQYMEQLGDLVRFPKSRQRLQVLFFSNEAQYRAHQESTAPHLASSAGYYSPLEDRMVVFNQFHSDQAKSVREEVDGKIQAMLSQARNAQERQHILNMQSSVEEQIRARGRLETVATLRHEGAHYLGYTYGVHSWIHAENAWLIEGCAVYFEPPNPGQIPLSHLNALIQISRDQRLPALHDLMEVRMPADFEQMLPGLTAVEAYALSWTLFHFCMQPENREGFKSYLRSIQNPPNIRSLMQTPRIEQLAHALGMDSGEELDQQWRRHLSRL